MTPRLAWLGLLVLGALWPYDVLGDVHPERADLGPGLAHWLGTDHLGRDVLRRASAAAAAFLVPGFGAAALATLAGTALGAAIGWTGGPVAAALRSVTGAVAAIPSLILVLLVLLVTGPGPLGLALAAGLAATPTVAGALAERVEALRRAEFVLAARAHGIGDARILWFHLVWTNGGPLLVREAAAALGGVLVLEVTLSYLGEFGVAEPAASWGNMLAHAFSSGSPNPWTWLAPAAAVLTTLWATVYDPEAR